MARRLLDYNPTTGETTWFDYDNHADSMTITHEQDVKPSLDYSHVRAADGDYSAKGIKGDLWHYARVPNIVIMEMKSKHGVDFFDKNHERKVFQLLNTEYKWCKTTTKTHNVR